jgi:hypothetical protein
METLSANTLFHFTDSIDNIENILINEFCPRYSLEKIGSVAFDSSYEVAIPMVCFCDIPLSQIKNHIKYYGNYAIGLKKEWGIKRKINPVLYLYENSATAIHLKKIISSLDPDINKNQAEQPIIVGAVSFVKYLKLYEGKLWKNNNYTQETIRFYDEREWRYVPEIATNDEWFSIITKKDFLNNEYRNQQTEKLKSQKLSFEPNDIKYIIVEKENEIFPMTQRIQAIKSKYSLQDVETLKARIVSMEQIKEDF